jgi:hypothetical protein
MRARGLEPLRAEAHQDLNLARLPIPPRPRGIQDRAVGQKRRMADPEQREEESQEDPTTKFEQARDEQRATTERVAEDIQDAPLTEREEH